MLNKLTSTTLSIALTIGLAGTSAFARNLSDAGANDIAVAVSETPTKTEAQRNEQLKNNVLNLVAAARAGKVAPPAKSQIQPARSNGWSKGTKIAVGVGVAVAVVAVVVLVQAKKGPTEGIRIF